MLKDWEVFANVIRKIPSVGFLLGCGAYNAIKTESDTYYIRANLNGRFKKTYYQIDINTGSCVDSIDVLQENYMVILKPSDPKFFFSLEEKLIYDANPIPRRG